MSTLRRYFTMLGVLMLVRLVAACSGGSSDPTATESASANPNGGCQGTDDDATGSDDADDGEDADEPGDDDCGDDED